MLISGCVRSVCCQLLWRSGTEKLLSPCYDGNRLAMSCSNKTIQAVGNKLLRACHQVVVTCRRYSISDLLGATCYESVGR